MSNYLLDCCSVGGCCCCCDVFCCSIHIPFTFNILRPIAIVDSGVKEEARRTRHKDGGESNTFVVETAVMGMRNEHSVAVLTLVTDYLNIPLFFV